MKITANESVKRMFVDNAEFLERCLDGINSDFRMIENAAAGRGYRLKQINVIIEEEIKEKK